MVLKVAKETKVKVIIAGSRPPRTLFTQTALRYLSMCREAVEEAVVESGFGITEVVCGGAAGADQAGQLWARRNGVAHTEKRFYVTNEEWMLSRGAGMARNIRMAEYADALIAIWDGKSRGTKHMIDEMQDRGKPVYVKKIDFRS